MRTMVHVLAGAIVAGTLAAPGASALEPGAFDAPTPDTRTTLVLASPTDAYFPLAEEIAQAEHVSLVHDLQEALARAPGFLLWVVAPGQLSDRALAEVGRALAARRSGVSIGIISGSTPERARALWLRADDARGERAFVANGEFPTADILEGRLRAIGSNQTVPLTKASLADALRRADYVTFTGHGGAAYLSLAPGNAFTAGDVPDLPPVVVGTASCQTFRPWREHSIALALADRGAAAYAGFSLSPNEGFLLGEFDGLPFRYTWDEFPIGLVMHVQAQGTLRGFAAFPYYFLLGDPRIALQSRPPYRVVDDRREGDTRSLTFADAPAGVLPVRIENAAEYRLVEIPGVASTSDHEVFFNARILTANVGTAKYLLFKHPGGNFSVHLRRTTPLARTLLEPVRDALDGALVALQRNGGMQTAIGVGLVVWAVNAWRVRRRKLSLAPLPMALGIGTGLAVLHGAYAWMRLGHIAINEKPVVFGPASLAGTLIVGAGAALLYLGARSRRSKLLAVVIGVLPPILGAAVVAAMLTLVNVIAWRQLGAGHYNYSLALMPLIAAAVEAGLLFVLCESVWRTVVPRPS